MKEQSTPIFFVTRGHFFYPYVKWVLGEEMSVFYNSITMGGTTLENVMGRRELVRGSVTLPTYRKPWRRRRRRRHHVGR